MTILKTAVFAVVFSLSAWTHSAFATTDKMSCMDEDVKDIALAGGTCLVMIGGLSPFCTVATLTGGTEFVTTGLCGVGVLSTAAVCGLPPMLVVKTAYCLFFDRIEYAEYPEGEEIPEDEEKPTEFSHAYSQPYGISFGGRLGQHVP